VRAPAGASADEAGDLDQVIRLALNVAFRKGHSSAEVRAAVERWLRAAPPERVVIVDPRQETIELVIHEVSSVLGVPVTGCTLEQLAGERELVTGALALALPYHAGKVARLVPGALVKTIRVRAWAADRQVVAALPAGASVLIVSRSPIVLQMAAALVGSMRGDELLVEPRNVACESEWRRLLPVADLVLADVLAAPIVRRARPRRLHELRIVGQDDLERVRDSLSAVSLRP
jgi:hypothetical protein